MTAITEKMVEAGARAICEAQGLDWDAQISAMTSGGGDDNEQDGYREMARACLTAALATEVAGEPVALTAKEAMDAGMKIAEDHALVVKSMHDQFGTDVAASLHGNKVWLAAQIMKAMQAVAPPKPAAVPTVEEIEEAIFCDRHSMKNPCEKDCYCVIHTENVIALYSAEQVK